MSMENLTREMTCSLPVEQDVHHICFQGRKWKSFYAKSIRGVFARRVPVEWHRELHKVLKNVPVPDEATLWQAWLDYQHDKRRIDQMGICEAIAWLYVHVPDPDFRKAMQVQLNFFAVKYQETA